MALFILAAPGPARADFNDLKNDGDGYYIIAASKDKDLCDFRDGINGGSIPLSAKARLTTDIDLSDTDGNPTEWAPIGKANNGYTGTFDGAGHTVKGYKIKERAVDIGFFGVVDSGGTVRGLTVSGDINIIDTGDGADAGGVAGRCYSGTIEDCVNAGSLTTTNTIDIGGIVGYCKYSRISNCVNSGDITSSRDIARTGGIAGSSESGTISNCRNDGKVSNSSSGYTGGIAGESISTISNCINCGDVKGGGDTGGVAGNNSFATISNCLNGGDVTGGQDTTGGVAGNNNSGKISNCGWLKTDTVKKGVGKGDGENNTFKLDQQADVDKSVVALSADITKHALNNGQTADISLSTLFGEPNKFGDYVTSVDVKISDTDILSYEKIDEKTVRLTAKAKGGAKRATTKVTLSPVLYPTDFNSMNRSNNPSEPPLKLTFGVTVTNTAKVSGVAITSHDISIYKGESARLTATVEPPEAANLKVFWSSGDSGIVSVDKDSGEILAVAVGSADITVTTEDTGDDGRQRTDTSTVTVKPVNVVSVDISQKTLSIDMNNDMPPYELTAIVFPDNADYGQVVWESSNEKVSVVSPDKNDAKALTAYVTPVGRGEAIITASVGDVSADRVVTVTPVWSENITVSPDLLTLEAGKSAKLSAKVGPEKATDKSVRWKSGDKDIATVSESGEVFAHNPGCPVLITATAGGARDDKEVSASCSLTVTAPRVPVESVRISPEGAAIKVGESFQFTANILPENADNKKGVTWKSGDEKIATVDANGKVTALAVGTAAITVTTVDGLKAAQATVSVNRVYTSGSGGCAAGVGALALFALIPLLLKKRRPTK
ncbi:MAG: Ig-like domain-containing protein [Synergistaceae bacterium]|nr:Ig-like domain-containing protein [Synergistaceae bacterium]